MQTREANAFVPVRASEVVGCVACGALAAAGALLGAGDEAGSLGAAVSCGVGLGALVASMRWTAVSVRAPGSIVFMSRLAKRTGAPFGSGLTTRIVAVSSSATARAPPRAAGTVTCAVTVPVVPGVIDGSGDSTIWLATVEPTPSTRDTSIGQDA